MSEGGATGTAPEQVDVDAPKWCHLDFPPLKSVACRHADESIAASITNGEVELVIVGLMVRSVGADNHGMFIAVPPRVARLIAAGLIEKANELDGGKGNQ